MSGKDTALLPRPPLRTTRDSFPSSRSNLSNAFRKTRFLNLKTKTVNLLVAIGVEQHPVFHPIVTAMYSPNQVVTVPAALFGDFLTTDRTDTRLQ